MNKYIVNVSDVLASDRIGSAFVAIVVIRGNSWFFLGAISLEKPNLASNQRIRRAKNALANGSIDDVALLEPVRTDSAQVTIRALSNHRRSIAKGLVEAK
jgi:DNA modification methylase